MLEATEYEKKEFLKLLKESANRQCEALKLYRPLPFQDAFHKCTAKECVLQKGNQAGGSLAGFAEDARAITNQDPYDKYPKTGTCVCLGFGEKHIGRVIHKYLFRADAFRVIRDKATGDMRVFRPWPNARGGDWEDRDQSLPAPPLIAPRFIEELTWEKRGEKVFSIARMTTGWEVYALNSAGDPSQAQGFQVDLYHIDEDTASPGWYEEALGRCSIRQGKIRWTALPHQKNDDLLNMIQRAEDEQGSTNPITVVIRASMFDNPYYPEESRKANLKAWADQGEDVVRKRAYGELVLDTVLMYPAFSKGVHNAIRNDDGACKAQAILTEAQNEPPRNWCLDMVVDPGHTTCAVTFWCTPPPEIGDFHICYDELYIRQCDAEMFGDAVRQKVGTRDFQRFIIDAHGGKLREIGSGIRPQAQYEAALKARNIRCQQSGSYFLSGADDVEGRVNMLRNWMRVRDNGFPTFFISVDRCPNTVRELERFKKRQKRVGSMTITIDEGARNVTHAVETLEYAAGHGLPYVKPPMRTNSNTWVDRVLRERKYRQDARQAQGMLPTSNYINLGPRGDAT